ncbi:MAG TPA: SDR family NAD(P)-dependent oxidoreductase [Acidimicrobiales bacterium]
MNAREVLAQTVDTALEATVVLSFSRVGYDVRSRLFAWSDLTERPMAGKVAVVTGATSGLGLSAATRLAALGASVRLLGRDIGRTEAARRAIMERTGNPDIEIGVADLGVLDDVRRFAEMLLRYHDRLDVVINNAGALVRDRQITVDGLELTTQTHVVAPFLLTAQLLPLLTRTPGSRVITVSSGGMYTERLDLDHLVVGPAPSDEFDGVKAYARAKRAQVVLNRRWAERAAATGVTFHAMHPGWVDTPGIQTALPAFSRRMGPLLRTPEQGADTMVWLAAARAPLATNGAFWLDRHRRWTSKLPWTHTSAADAERLWTWVADRAGLGNVFTPPLFSAN